MLFQRTQTCCTLEWLPYVLDKCSVPGQETVGIQDPVGTQCKVLSNDMLYAFATALLDQLEDYGANVKEHDRGLRTRQYTADPRMRLNPP